MNSISATAVVSANLKARFPELKPALLVDVVRKTNSFIAGGFILQCVLDGHNTSDVDVFCDVTQEAEWLNNYPLLKRVDGRAFYDYECNMSGITAVYRSNEGLNLIVCKSVIGKLDDFDLDLCKACYDGHVFSNIEHVADKKITILKPFSGEAADVESRISRVSRYRFYGFTFTNLRERMQEYLKRLAVGKPVTLSNNAIWQLIHALDGAPKRGIEVSDDEPCVKRTKTQ